LLDGEPRDEELKRARSLPKVTVSSREMADLIMMEISGFTPLIGFMDEADWRAEEAVQCGADC